MSAPPSTDLQRLIDRHGVGRLQRRVLLLCAGVLLLDGIDIAMVSYLAPSLMADWGLSKAQLGPVVTSGLVGLALGSLVGGPLADRLGRRRIIIASLVFFGLMCAATALTTDIWWFSILRVLTGFGLGAAMPSSTTLVSEYAPSRRRGVMMAIAYCGVTLGAALAGYLTSAMVQIASWHWALIVGGVLPLAYAVVVHRWLPESPKFLARRADRADELAVLVNRMLPEPVPAGTRFTLDEPSTGAGVSVGGLLASRFRLGTATIWLGFVAAFFIIYLVNSWLPILLTDVGFSLTATATIGVLLQLGATIGNFGIGWLMDRFGLHRTAAVGMACAAVMLVLIAVAPPTMVVVGVLIFLLGVFLHPAGTGFPILSAAFYPTAIRATGTSWATGIARIGAIGGAAAGTLLVALGLQYQQVFLVLLVPAAVTISAVVLKGRAARTPKATSDDTRDRRPEPLTADEPV
ncbi:AAHS family 4-hydroxybenzoate transporter-like MFS transporter [Pseudonocardia hierapolitana]|uniref:AAHS family 4-hydroxybenzoate transporter-like MFS transporter n=1 Tax=Pseudonocardia hierapolitana TaxID=1128676 RepID=A0A561SZP7_9PSEU|nr:aromatic acid/H+ symport family MFS transporter [Pseudonocardia hierapolitana]TWF80340.1 AAHS family 4-hydroxybenzoate transporter-like MFS transporter [Pseudonocardia hierapolitana]